MKRKQNSSLRSSVLQITFISLSAVLLTLAGASAKNQFEQKPAAADMALQDAQHCAAVSESAVTLKPTKAQKSAVVQFSPSRQRVGDREVAGFSMRTTQEENFGPPAGLKPAEQEAWLAMARRQSSAGNTGFTSF